MKPSPYRERDYAFGQSMLILRTEIGLTQAGLAKHLGIARRTVGEWEAGNSYPKVKHLKEVIALAVKHQAWPSGYEAEEIRALWKAARQKVPLDERWLSALLDRSPSLPLPLVPKPVEETMHNASVEPLKAPGGLRVDWGDALAVPLFYGREEELAQLSQWLVQDRCHVVNVLGMGGIGKSALAVKLMYQEASHFEVVIFRSLRNVPALEVLLDECLQVLSPQSLGQAGQAQGTVSTEEHIRLLLSHFHKARVLLVLDNLEALIKDGDTRGHFRPGLEKYELLLNRVAETSHQSCLLLTSRERPAILRPLESKYSQVRTLRLAGLDTAACQQLFIEKGLASEVMEERDANRLIEAYSGNPLALKIVTETILDLFGGDIGTFLAAGTAIFGSVNDLLDEQFTRITKEEQSVLCWLAIAREVMTINELLAVLVTPLPRVQVFETIDSLRRRALLEPGKRAGSFTLQSVILEYVTALLVAEGSREIQERHLDKLIQYGLSQAHAKEYVRQAQERLLVVPLLADLQSAYWEAAKVEQQLIGLFDQLRERDDVAQGYGPANLIALLRLQRGHLNGLDLSHLYIRSAYLQGTQMQECSLSFALMRDCVWTQAISATWSLALSSDGKWWAAGDIPGQVRIWEEGGQTLHLSFEAHANTVLALAFSPDGQTLATGSVDGSVKLWDLEVCRRGASPRDALLWKGKQKNPLCLAFSPDGTLLMCGGTDVGVQFWDAHSGLHQQTLGPSPRVLAVAFSPDGRLFACGCVDGEIRLWERQKGTAPNFVPILSVQDNCCVSALSFAPDGSMLAGTSMGNHMVKLWEVGSHGDGSRGRLLQTLPEHTDQSWFAAWSPDSSTLAYNSVDKAIRLWDVEKGRCRAALHGHTAEVHGMAFTPDGTRLLSSSADGTLRVWDVISSRCIHVIQGYQCALWDLCWSPDGRHLVSGGTDGLVTLSDVSERTPPRILRGHSWFVSGVTWSPDGKHVVSGGTDGALLLWDPITHECLERFGDPEVLILSVAWSPREDLLACGTYQRGIRVWDMTTRHLRWSSNATLSESDFVLAWSPNGRLLASGGNSGCVYLWESADGTLRARLSSHQGWVQSVGWSPDGRFLASGSGDLFIWDVETAERVQTLARHSGMVSALAWGPNGKALVSGDNDGQLRWWNVESGECVNRQEAHCGAIRSLRVSPDGQFLASCGEDGAIMIWDVECGEHLRTLRRDRPYERLNITGIRGLNEAEIASLQALGAFDEEAPYIEEG